MGKTPVCIKPEYVLYLEWFGGHSWFHTDVFKWNKTTKKQFVKDVTQVQSLLPLPILAFVEEEKTQVAKFAEKVGFVLKETIMSKEGQRAFIYAWSK